MLFKSFFFAALLVTLFSCNTHRQTPLSPDITVLLDRLDRDITQKENFKQQRQQQINYLKKALDTSSSPEIRFLQNAKIINEYLGFQCDSAYSFIDANLALARQSGNRAWLTQTRIQYASLLASVGLFVEAKENLDSIKESELPPVLRFDYYATLEKLYRNMVDYDGGTGRFAQLYKKDYAYFSQKALNALPAGSPKVFLWQFHLDILNKQWAEALKNINIYIAQTENGTPAQAAAYAGKSEIFNHIGDKKGELNNLILSASADLRSATMENRSIQELAVLLYDLGYVDRAYRYLQSALADANFYNARFRNIKISKSLPMIEQAYQKKIREKNRQQQAYTILVSVLLIILLVTTFQFYRQKRRLVASRREQDRLNSTVSDMYIKQQELNRLLQAKNRELFDKNEQLTDMTQKLSQTNSIEEAYLIKFLKMCSEYVRQLDEYKSIVYQKLITGQIKDLQKMISSTLMQTERKELYKVFDKAFLDLYPDFIDRINELFLPEERIKWNKNKNKGLTSEMRVIALIRLGIKDSAQISEFLGYSPATTYTYRTKMKNKAIHKESFSADLMKIGQIKGNIN